MTRVLVFADLLFIYAMTMIDCQSWQSEKKHIGFSTVHKSFNRDCAGPLILVGAPNPCVKLTLPSYLLTNNNLLKLWRTFSWLWLAVNDDYRMVCYRMVCYRMVCYSDYRMVCCRMVCYSDYRMVSSCPAQAALQLPVRLIKKNLHLEAIIYRS